MQLDPHVELVMALASGAAWLMMKAGLAKNALEFKRRRPTCPSCGRNAVFDGTFSGTRVPGVGVTTALLERHGVRVFSETDLESARQWLERLEATSEAPDNEE